MRRVLLLALLLAAAGCGARGAGGAPSPGDAPPPGTAVASPDPGAPIAGTPVKVASVRRATLAVTVSAPGRTQALAQQKIRAPFAGRLTDLKVTDGDRVRRGEVVGTLVSRDSEAAVRGAEEMAQQAESAEERADAARALTLARKEQVQAPLAASADGVVLSHTATAGDRVSEDQEILTVASAESVVFVADVVQSDLPSLRPGQPARIDVPARAVPLAGVVHEVLSAANAADLTVPVRIDLRPLPDHLGIGLFGTARITIAEHRDVPAVPEAAVLRDDVTGAARVATVGGDGRVRWVAVSIGARDGGLAEILPPGIADGSRVIVSGQVGLPEGAPVVAP